MTRTRTIATTTASTASTGVNAWKRLNAPPVLRLRRSSRVVPMIDSGPSASAATAHAFVSWSSAITPSTIPAASASRRCSWARSGAGSLPASLRTGLAVDALLGVRDGLEPLEGDPPSRGHAQAVSAGVHAGQGPVDRLHDAARRRRQQQVALTLDVDGVALARLLVELGVTGVAFHGERVGLGLELVGLAQVASPLVLQPAPQPVDRLGRQVGRRRHDLEPGERADDRSGLARRDVALQTRRL